MEHIRRLMFLALLALVPAWGQENGSPVVVVAYPKEIPTRFLDYNGGTNLTYLCVASPIYNGGAIPSPYAYSLSVTGGTLTSIAVSSNVGTVTTVAANGLMAGQPMTVSGSTTSALNGNYVIQSIVSTTVFTISTSGVGNATYNNSALTISGTAPLLTAPIWSISHYIYDGNNNLTGTQCANGACNVYTNVCANRANLSYK